jgi:protein-tyrosine phosphatase
MREYIENPALLDQITDRIFIGSYWAATALDYGNKNSITHVLNCTPTAHQGLKHLTVNQINIHDGQEIPAETVWFAIRTISEALHSGGKILVHCQAGISRSVGIVCGFLMYNGFSWNEALNFVQSSRPIAYPHPKIELSIKKALGQAITEKTTLFGVNNVTS